MIGRRAATRVVATAVAVTAGMVSPGVARAQIGLCDPAGKPAAHFKGLPDRLIFGRSYAFGIAENVFVDGEVDSDYQVSMTENGTPFWTGTQDRYDDERSLYIRSDPGDAPLTVSASYTEYLPYADYPAPSECRRVIVKTMPGIPGRQPRTPRVRGRYEEGDFELRVATSDCRRRYAPAPVAVSVRHRHSRRWSTVAVGDQCDGWHAGASGRHFALRPESDEPRRLLFVPRTPARDGREYFDYKLSRATVADNGRVHLHRTLRRGVLRVKTDHSPAERVYGFDRNDNINDEYWNFCVNEGKQTWMHNGNPYCIDHAFTYRAVKLMR